MAIDTIFLCFCEDSARNDGINKPYYMSKDLMHFVENSGKALEAMDKRNEVKQNEAKHMMVQERRYSEDSIAMVDVDWETNRILFNWAVWQKMYNIFNLQI